MHYKDLPLQCSPIKSTVWNEPNSTDDIWVSPYKVNYFMIDIQRLIIPRWAKCFVLLDSWTFCCPVLGSRHCTNTWPFLSAWHRSTAVQSAFSDMVMLTVWRWRVGSTLTEDACHPHPFSPYYKCGTPEFSSQLHSPSLSPFYMSNDWPSWSLFI